MAIASMSKDNFWNRKRVENNIRFVDLSKLYGGVVSKWGMYFTGQVMPPVSAVSKLCEFFDVEFNFGYQQFVETHENWRAAHGQERVLITGGAETRKTSVKPKTENTSVKACPDVNDYSDVLALVYGKLNYPEYNQFVNRLMTKKGNPLELLYGKIDYESFQQVLIMLNGGVK